MTTENNELWNDPNSPFYGALGEDSGPEETEDTEPLYYGVGGWGNVTHELFDALHDDVHETLGGWIKTRLSDEYVEIHDCARVASNCLTQMFVTNLESLIVSSNHLDTQMLHEAIRIAVQAGYLLRMDEENGTIKL